MAKGVMQDQVNAAIDDLVAAGERPTIERVRLKLGTGSPNTITRMLDVWWTQLHERLSRQQAKLAVPDAPEEVAVAATHLWQLALDHAGARAEQATATLRETLMRDQAALATERAGWEARLQQSTAAAAEAHRTRLAAEGRLADLQRLLDQQTAQMADLQTRLSQSMAQIEETSLRLDAAQQTLVSARSEATTERAVMEAAHRAAEDRWMREVDRARREEAKMTARLQQVETASQATIEKAASELALQLTQQRRSEQDIARKDARIVTLEEQLDRLHNQLNAALVNAKQTSAEAGGPHGRKQRRAAAAFAPSGRPGHPSKDGLMTKRKIRNAKTTAPRGKKSSTRSSLVAKVVDHKAWPENPAVGQRRKPSAK